MRCRVALLACLSACLSFSPVPAIAEVALPPLIGQAQPVETAGSATGRSPAEAAAIVGVYRAVFPCADCTGIRVTLTLYHHGGFDLEQVYLKRATLSMPRIEGQWRRILLDSDDIVIELFSPDIPDDERRCFGVLDMETLAPYDMTCSPMPDAAFPRLKRSE
jgi:hypothetical protein